MNPEVDAYIAGSTRWPAEMAALRSILLGAGLSEEFKWRQPCYCQEGKNVVIMQEFKNSLALMFFKGALLKDPQGVLQDQGPNSRSARRICFRSVNDVERLAVTVAAYVGEALAVERLGLNVGPAPDPMLAAELQSRLDGDAALKAAFESLTPGRRREYNLHFSGAKQSRTRAARVEKFIPKILAGKGLRDR